MKKQQLAANDASLTALIGQQSDEQIAKWKEENPDGIFAYKVQGHIAYFRNPDRDDVNCACAKADPKHQLAVAEELADLLFLGGSEDVVKNSQMFLSISTKLTKKMDGLEGELVNL